MLPVSLDRHIRQPRRPASWRNTAQGERIEAVLDHSLEDTRSPVLANDDLFENDNLLDLNMLEGIDAAAVPVPYWFQFGGGTFSVTVIVLRTSAPSSCSVISLARPAHRPEEERTHAAPVGGHCIPLFQTDNTVGQELLR